MEEEENFERIDGGEKREWSWEKREKGEQSQFQKPRERKIMENEIFLGPNYLNTPFPCNYQNTLCLKRVKYDSEA
jgi:hypothetical protein